jgi:hypothetical protein
MCHSDNQLFGAVAIVHTVVAVVVAVGVVAVVAVATTITVVVIVKPTIISHQAVTTLPLNDRS